MSDRCSKEDNDTIITMLSMIPTIVSKQQKHRQQQQQHSIGCHCRRCYDDSDSRSKRKKHVDSSIIDIYEDSGITVEDLAVSDTAEDTSASASIPPHMMTTTSSAAAAAKTSSHSCTQPSIVVVTSPTLLKNQHNSHHDRSHICSLEEDLINTKILLQQQQQQLNQSSYDMIYTIFIFVSFIIFFVCLFSGIVQSIVYNKVMEDKDDFESMYVSEEITLFKLNSITNIVSNFLIAFLFFVIIVQYFYFGSSSSGGVGSVCDSLYNKTNIKIDIMGSVLLCILCVWWIVDLWWSYFLIQQILQDDQRERLQRLRRKFLLLTLSNDDAAADSFGFSDVDDSDATATDSGWSESLLFRNKNLSNLSNSIKHIKAISKSDMETAADPLYTIMYTFIILLLLILNIFIIYKSFQRANICNHIERRSGLYHFRT